MAPVMAAALALMLLAAHALRMGDMGQTACWLGLALLLPTRRGWVRLVCSVALAAGFFLWIDRGLELVMLRQAMHAPWLRLAVIMTTVGVFTGLASLWLMGERAERFFHRATHTQTAQAAIFLLSTALLLVTRAKTPMPVLLLDRYLPAWGLFEVFALSTYAAWLGGRLLDPVRAPATRAALWAFFSLVFFGQLILGLAGLERMLMTGTLHLPVPALIIGGPLYRGSGFFMPILFTVTVVLVGPAWCSHLCYIGAWDDRMSRLRDRGRKKPRRPRLSAFWTRWGRVITLALVIATALGLRLWGASVSVAVAAGAVFGLLGVGIMVTLSRRAGGMVHCTAYCPMGLVANLLGRLTPWRMRMDENCTRCGLCTRACRYGALEKRHIARGRPGLSCTLCGDCMTACRHSAMHYRFARLSPRASRTLFVVLVTSLHALFLGVARI